MCLINMLTDCRSTCFSWLLSAQDELRAYCEKEGIRLTAYASLGGQDGSKAKWEALGGRLLEAPPVLAAAAAHEGATPAQVLLRWVVQKGAQALTRSRNEKRLREAAEVTSFALSDADMRTLDGLAWLVESAGHRPPPSVGDAFGVNEPRRRSAIVGREEL